MTHRRVGRGGSSWTSCSFPFTVLVSRVLLDLVEADAVSVPPVWVRVSAEEEGCWSGVVESRSLAFPLSLDLSLAALTLALVRTGRDSNVERVEAEGLVSMCGFTVWLELEIACELLEVVMSI